MGFGVMSETQASYAGSLTVSRTGVAGASAAEVQPGGGDYVWRIVDAGARLELCHAGWATRPCRTTLFDGGPNTIAPFLRFSTNPTIVDPVNLGRGQVVSVDANGNGWVFGGLKADLDKFTMPATPGSGVWAFGGSGGLHHCQLEGERPNCRVTRTATGEPTAGVLVSIKTYADEGQTRDGAWLVGGTALAGGMQHCEVKSGGADPPTCKAAQITPGQPSLWAMSLLSSHVVADRGRSAHVIWFQLPGGSIGRCQARGGDAPVCDVVRKD